MSQFDPFGYAAHRAMLSGLFGTSIASMERDYPDDWLYARAKEAEAAGKEITGDSCPGFFTRDAVCDRCKNSTHLRQDELDVALDLFRSVWYLDPNRALGPPGPRFIRKADTTLEEERSVTTSLNRLGALNAERCVAQELAESLTGGGES